MTLTINQAIDRLMEVREAAKLGSDTCVVICLPDVEYLGVEAINVESDPDGSTALVYGPTNVVPESLDGLSHRELGTILAALRYWQRTRADCVVYEPDYAEDSHAAAEDGIATDEGDIQALQPDEIDELCQRITHGARSIDRRSANAVIPSPGPWTERGSTRFGNCAIYDARGVLVAGNVDSHNGPVIAASIELLAAAKGIDQLAQRVETGQADGAAGVWHNGPVLTVVMVPVEMLRALRTAVITAELRAPA